MEDKTLGALGLRTSHEAINEVIHPLVSDWDKVETAMTKTSEGYVYEIRYKDLKKGWPWKAELPTDPEFIKKMETPVETDSTTSSL